MDLFEREHSYDLLEGAPLAERLRPQKLEQVVGQTHLIKPGMPLFQVVQTGQLHSMILWGPPGVGKTTLARVLAHSVKARFVTLSAVSAGVKELREVFEHAQFIQQTYGEQTILFIDEIHRFSKSQQDVILPEMESGKIIFIGATTENPSFSLNQALLSRAMVYVLKSLESQDLQQLLTRSMDASLLTESQSTWLIAKADGDARRLLNFVDRILSYLTSQPDLKALEDTQLFALLQSQPQRFDDKGDIFYEQLSAFHKSVRGSSPDGALYWMARMITAGADPLHIIRRLTAIASEDIGNADPRALEITLHAWDAFLRLGDAEGCRAIAHAAVYCAVAPKSNAIELAYQAALEAAKTSQSLTVPDHLCNAPTYLLKSLGKGKGYRYAHDEPHAYAAGQSYLPLELQNSTFYHPTAYGLEQKIQARLDALKKLDGEFKKV